MYSEQMIYKKTWKGKPFMGEHESERTARCDDSRDEQTEDILAVAVSKAEELLQVLKEEEEILKRLNNQALMAVLPRKELLVRELMAKATLLKKGNEENPEIAKTSEYGRLKAFLAEIDRLNRSNQVFIESSLAYFNDFIDCICPSNYGPGQDGQAIHKSATFKGLSFRKEI